MYAIYKITNEINGKIYIGYTTQIPASNRFKMHKIQSMVVGKNHFLLHKAMRKHGTENFSFKILKEGIDEEWGLKVEEPYFIGMWSPEYNLTLGGDGRRGVLSTETKLKIGASHKGKQHTKEHVENQRRTHIGQKRSELTKQRISQARNGRALSEQHKQSIKMGVNEIQCKERMSVAKKKIVQCPYCNKFGSGPMYRWHFNNCKEK